MDRIEQDRNIAFEHLRAAIRAEACIGIGRRLVIGTSDVKFVSSDYDLSLVKVVAISVITKTALNVNGTFVTKTTQGRVKAFTLGNRIA